CRALERTAQRGSLTIPVRFTLALAALAGIVRNPEHESRIRAGGRRTMDVSRGGRTTEAGIAAFPRQSFCSGIVCRRDRSRAGGLARRHLVRSFQIGLELRRFRSDARGG